MLRALPDLSELEQSRFGWLKAYAGLVAELGISFGLANSMRVHL